MLPCLLEMRNSKKKTRIYFKRYWKISGRLLILALISLICSVKDKNLLQLVRIQFEPIQGAQHYEIKFSVEDQEEQKIIQIKKGIFMQKIPRKYKSFQIRAIFSDEVKTSWSLIRHLDQTEEEIDHSKLIVTDDVRYRTIVQINHPYYYRNNILWVGPNTKLSFRAANPLFVSQKKIFYQFRQKYSKIDNEFIPFVSTIALKSIFQDIEDSYIISFYSINHKRIKEPVREVIIYVDTNSPQITFEKKEKVLLWKFFDKSLPVKAVLKQGGSILESKEGVTIMKLDLTQGKRKDISSLSLVATDFLGNQGVWLPLKDNL